MQDSTVDSTEEVWEKVCQMGAEGWGEGEAGGVRSVGRVRCRWGRWDRLRLTGRPRMRPCTNTMTPPYPLYWGIEGEEVYIRSFGIRIEEDK